MKILIKTVDLSNYSNISNVISSVIVRIFDNIYPLICLTADFNIKIIGDIVTGSHHEKAKPDFRVV